MSKLEKFSLGTGIIGLLADVLGLFVIYKSLLGEDTPGELPISWLHLLIFLLLTYGWFSVDWVIVKTKIRNNKKRRQKSSDVLQEMFSVTIGFIIVLLPFVTIWLYSLVIKVSESAPAIVAIVAFLLAAVVNAIIGFGTLYSIYFLMPIIDET